MSDSGRTPIYGPEPWRTKRNSVWSYWDLWFCVVALADHDGDLDALAGSDKADLRVRGKARSKVRGHGLYPRDLTDAMRFTPRDRLYERALRGRWPLFPISPEPFYERLVNGLGDGYRPKGATFRLERRIEAARERLDRQTAKSPAARLAARRALLAFCYCAMQRCDDSYGVIGELAQEALLTYAKLPFEPAGIAGETRAAGRLTRFAEAAAKLGSDR